MSLFTAAHATAAAKSHIDVLTSLTNTAFDGFEQLVQLNLQATKSALEESADAAQAALSAKTLPDLLKVSAGALQPSVEKAAAYGRSVYAIASSVAAELSEVAQGQLVQAQKGVAGAVDQALKHAPQGLAGSDSTVNLVKSAIAAANNTYEAVNKAAKQAADLAEANIAAVTGAAVKAAKAGSKTAKKAA